MPSTQYLPDEINEGIRSALWRLHAEKGVPQAEIAKRVGIGRTHLSPFMRGHRDVSLDTAQRLLAVCGLRLSIEIVPIESEER